MIQKWPAPALVNISSFLNWVPVTGTEYGTVAYRWIFIKERKTEFLSHRYISTLPYGTGRVLTGTAPFLRRSHSAFRLNVRTVPRVHLWYRYR